MHRTLLPPTLKTTLLDPLPIISAEFEDFKMSEGLVQLEPFRIFNQFLSPVSASGLESMYSNTVLSLIKWILTD